MRTLFLLITSICIAALVPAIAQKSSFGVLKYAAPSGWQQQSRINMVSYFGSLEGGTLPVEINIYDSQPAASAADSSFRQEWGRILDNEYGNPSPPTARRRYNSNGLRLAVNISNPVEVQLNDETRYSQLIVFFVNKQMQAVQFLTNGPKDYRAIRLFIDDFIENVEPAIPLVN